MFDDGLQANVAVRLPRSLKKGFWPHQRHTKPCAKIILSTVDKYSDLFCKINKISKKCSAIKKCKSKLCTLL